MKLWKSIDDYDLSLKLLSLASESRMQDESDVQMG